MQIKHSSVMAAILAALALPASAVVTIDWVTVGDINNPADTMVNWDATTGYGAVDHVYQIGKYEVTNAQYGEFLNKVDPAGTNPYSIYSTNMAGSYGGISFNAGAADGSKYSLIAGRENKPVVYVSWFDAARFSNWMHNGQGSGSTETGAYNLNGATSGIFTAQPGATIRLPGENEWYKAAYYQPAAQGGDTDGYWLYPTASNSVPSNDLINPDPGSNANFWDNGYTTGVAPYTTDVGEFENSASYYGTFDQGGNVYEWNDAVFRGSSRGLRGGDWGGDAGSQRSSYRVDYTAPDENEGIGFRLAGIPEPSVSLLVLIAGGLVATRRRRA